jgi:hypothetical protein
MDITKTFFDGAPPFDIEVCIKPNCLEGFDGPGNIGDRTIGGLGTKPIGDP